MDLTNLSDIEVLALTIYGEARGELIEGQVAVANVIRNRTNNGTRTFTEVCLAPSQFSCWGLADPNYKILIDYAQKIIDGELIQDRYLDQCLTIAQGVINEKLLDNTQGAKNYVTLSLFNSPQCPAWAKKFTLNIGNQIFGTA